MFAGINFRAVLIFAVLCSTAKISTREMRIVTSPNIFLLASIAASAVAVKINTREN